MKQRVPLAIFLSLLLVTLPTMLNSSWGSSVQAEGNAQDQTDALLREYDAALQNELLYGTTQEISDPTDGVTRILTGESQVKMDRLWAETLSKIETLQSRSEEARADTVAMVGQVSGVSPLYVSRSRTPYNPAAEIEEYEAGKFSYEVDVQSGQIVKIWIRDQKDYSTEPNTTTTFRITTTF